MIEIHELVNLCVSLKNDQTLMTDKIEECFAAINSLIDNNNTLNNKVNILRNEIKSLKG